MERSILVTGASKGIGRAIALRLARDGFAIAVHYGRDKEGASQTLDEIHASNGQGTILSFDVADGAQCRQVLESHMENRGDFYGVVLNAGIARDSVFPMMSEADWHGVLRTDLDGFYNVLQPVLMPMIAARKGGRIVTISSVAGLTGNRGQVNYSAAKAGLIGATKALAIELASRNITVNCVAPGLIETQMTAALPSEELIKLVPMRRMGRTEEVAAAVAFLCSDEASYVTRQVISVNGGMV